MQEENVKRPGEDREAEIWNAVSAFERVLEVLPDDRTALATLVDAYTRLGDFMRARQYLKRLAEAIVGEGDVAAAKELLGQLEAGDATDPALVEIRELLFPLIQSKSFASASAESAVSSPLSVHRPSIANEMALAWDLHQAGELTAEEYSKAVQDLTDLFSNTADQGLVSTLHVLEMRGIGRMESILGFVARKTEMPFIRLSDFEWNEEATTRLPIEVIQRAGVFPFEKLEGDLLVAIQNPYDKDLLTWVQQVTSAPCHFFITPPQEFASALDRLVQKAKEGKKGS